MNPCVYCGRLTTHEEKICSHCQQREKDVVSPDLYRQKKMAIMLTDRYKKPFRVVRNLRGELLVFPVTVLVQEGTLVMYETEVRSEKCKYET